jgi:hypothetical protein
MYVGGWCIDVDRSIFCGEEFMVDSYSSYDSYHIPEGAVDKPENLDLVNWLINNHPIESTIDIPGCYTGVLGFEEYQSAIWAILDNVEMPEDLIEGSIDCVVEHLVAQAETYGQDYEISCDGTDKIGVILVIDDAAEVITSQVLMAEISLSDIDGVCECDGDGYVTGDPHFKTWSGDLYDFHGICDLTLLKNPHFMNDLGMDIHIRSKQMKQFSFVSTAAIRIGSETFEVAGHKDGDAYWLNGKEGPADGSLEEGASISGFAITFRQVHSRQREYVVHISEEEHIVFLTWRDFVRVEIKGATKTNFHGSFGLMGSFDHYGVKMGRDEVTVYEDDNKFGMEWQVLASDSKLFHNEEGPQHPMLCQIPSQTKLRRRLAESTISQHEAEVACSRVRPEDRDLCVFDVMATNDVDVAGAY